MASYEWILPVDSEAWPCPEACGGMTEDDAGGPCRRCWDKVDDRERRGEEPEWPA